MFFQLLRSASVIRKSPVDRRGLPSGIAIDANCNLPCILYISFSGIFWHVFMSLNLSISLSYFLVGNCIVL